MVIDFKGTNGQKVNFYNSNKGLIFPGFLDGMSFGAISHGKLCSVEYKEHDYGIFVGRRIGENKFEFPDNKKEIVYTDEHYNSVYTNVFGLFGRKTSKSANGLTIYEDYFKEDGDIIRGCSFKNGKRFFDPTTTTGGAFNVLSNHYCLVTSNGEYYDNLLFRYPDGEVIKAYNDGEVKIENIGESSAYCIEKNGKYNVLCWNKSRGTNDGASFLYGSTSFVTYKPQYIKTTHNHLAVTMQPNGFYNLGDLMRGNPVFGRGVDKIYSVADGDIYGTLANESYGLLRVRIKSSRDYNYSFMTNLSMVDTFLEKENKPNADILDITRWRTTLSDGTRYDKLFFTDMEDEIEEYGGEPCIRIRCGIGLYNGDAYKWKRFGLKTKTLKD